ncbi:MAG: sigma-70 family RNA polymerase sigma factor [Gammaproteobacteria bacterium]|nr:sigma-70 family RNA polymerase sigma factor [Gammaproteobacteria bacterium]
MDDLLSKELDEDESLLWENYNASRNDEDRNKIVTLYLKQTKIIAATLYKKRYNNQIDFSDYYHFAIIGLIQSIERFDLSRRFKFMSYAQNRIRGSILNGISSMTEDICQSSKYKNVYQERLLTIRDANHDHNGDLFDEMIDLSIGLSIGMFLESETDFSNNSIYSYNEIAELKGILEYYVELLADDEKIIIRYHYFYGMTFKTIAEILNLSFSRIAQLHHKALSEIRSQIEAIFDRNF